MGTWVKASGIAPEAYQGLQGRVTQAETGDTHFMSRGKLGYYVLYRDRRNFLVKGLPATWLEVTSAPTGDDLLPWLLYGMQL